MPSAYRQLSTKKVRENKKGANFISDKATHPEQIPRDLLHISQEGLSDQCISLLYMRSDLYKVPSQDQSLGYQHCLRLPQRMSLLHSHLLQELRSRNCAAPREENAPDYSLYMCNKLTNNSFTGRISLHPCVMKNMARTIHKYQTSLK
jgi:hypothetical protein